MKYLPAISFLFVLFAGRGAAEVADSSASGFTVKGTYSIKASPTDVYARFVHRVGDWWNPEHTFSGSSKNLSIEDKAMGCFCEKLPESGSIRHLEVVYAAPGKKLVLTGGLGPMQSIATAGAMTIQFSPADGGTKLEMTYTVAGYLPAGMNSWAGTADGMLREQFTRFKNYVEKGDPAAK